jgi:hypothetical protein
MTECLTGDPGCCALERTCPSRPNWARINEAVASALAGVHLSDMVPRPSFSKAPAFSRALAGLSPGARR